MDRFGWLLLALLSGVMLPVQAALNAKMSKELNSAVWAAFISFFVGSIALLVIGLLSSGSNQLSSIKQVPGYVWTAGLLGALYVTATVIVLPRLGPALTFGLVVAGQMIVSLILDHFQLLVTQQHPINLYRIAGILFVIAGVVLIRRF